MFVLANAKLLATRIIETEKDNHLHCELRILGPNSVRNASKVSFTIERSEAAGHSKDRNTATTFTTSCSVAMLHKTSMSLPNIHLIRIILKLF